ncbi:MAG: hypothetical protein B0W54_23520 [Cellvibrio sp. 79]|nr:MAG: hypothetical protein B0W54_23520 [Cellvibrio sp. 79]
MKIYTVKPDSNFRLMYPEEAVYESDDWEFKCKPLAGKLPLHFEAYFNEKSDKPFPDIAWIGMNTFAFRADVATELVEILEESGELLPFKVDGDIWYCLNVLQKSESSVDPEKSSYEINDGETRFGLKQPAFIVKNLPKSPLFKIREDNYTNIYCLDHRSSESDIVNNFFCAVAAHAYTGVKFEEVFNDESDR